MPQKYGIPAELMEPVSVYAPEQLTFIQTIGRKHGLSDEEIRAKQAGYSRGLASTRIWLSEKNQIDGYRRLAITGLGLDYTMIMGVTQEGGLVASECTAELSQSVPLGQLIENFIEKSEVWNAANSFSFSFDINHYTNDAQWMRSMLFEARFQSLREGHWGSDEQTRFYAEMKGAILSRAGRNGGGIRKAIKDALDPEMVKASWGARATDFGHLSWFSGTSNGEEVCIPDPKSIAVLQRNRLQAFKAYPSLLTILRKPQITEVIDAGEPLTKALSDLTRVPEVKLRLLKGKGARAIGNPLSGARHRVQLANNAPSAALNGLKTLDQDILPRRGSDWQKLWNTDDAIRFTFSVARCSQDLSDLDMRALRSKQTSAERSYQRRYLDFEKSFPDIASQNFRDMINSVATKLIIPAVSLSLPAGDEAPKSHTNVTVEKEFLLRSSFKDIQAASEKWHRNLARIEENLGSDRWGGIKTSWRPLLQDQTIEGYHVQEINSDKALTCRGRTENHCVGGYGGAIRAAGNRNAFSLIYAVDGDTASLSTIEVNVVMDGKAAHYSINQNLGAHNARPDADADKVANALLKNLEATPPKRLETYRRRMQDVETSRISGMKGFSPTERECGVGFAQPGYLQAAWNEMQEYLPRSLRKAGLEEVANIFTSQELMARNRLVAEAERLRHAEPPKSLADVYDYANAREEQEYDMDPEVPF
jgi:hypothetical protein